MRVRLRGINSVARTLKDGTRVTYWYAWKGGPRLDGQPGDREFIASYNRAVGSLTAPAEGLLLNVLVKFQQTEEFRQLAARTREDYKEIRPRASVQASSPLAGIFIQPCPCIVSLPSGLDGETISPLLKHV
jgi:hypothetical protein